LVTLALTLVGCGGGSSDSALGLGPSAASVAPSFTTAPSSLSLTEPSAASWTVVASGTPAPALQWQLSIDAGVTWANIVGATASTYTLAATALADDGKRYRVVATNVAGSTTSSVATLAVAPAPTLPGGSDLFTAAATPRIVTPTLDPGFRASALITPAGGTLVLDGAAGARYTLTVPAGALVQSRLISMNALSGVSGDGFDRFVAGVQLEPAGLQLLDFATLEITGIAAPPSDRRIHAGIDGPIDGELFLNLFDNSTNAIRLKLLHFSSAYVSEGSPAQRAAAVRAFTTAAANRVSSALSASLATQPRGSLTPASLLDEISLRYQEDVLRFQTASVPASCTEGFTTLSSVFSLTRTLLLLGQPAPNVVIPPTFLNDTISKCIAEANCSLVKRLTLYRQVQLRGGSQELLDLLDAEEARCSAAWSGLAQWSVSGTLHRTEGACVIDETRQGSGYVEYNSTGGRVASDGGVLPGVNVIASEASRYAAVCSYLRADGDTSDCYLSQTENIITRKGRADDPSTQLVPLEALVSIVGDRYIFQPSGVLVPVDRVDERWETQVCRSNNNQPVRTSKSRIMDTDFAGPLWDIDLGGPWSPGQTELAGSRTAAPQAGGVDLDFRSTLQQTWSFKRP
jgi:hypothetical protein